MNKSIILLSLLLYVASCNSSANKSDENSKNKEQNQEIASTQAISNDNAEGKVISLTDATFKQAVFNYSDNQEWKYEGDIPCIVDFYADWCGPCKMVAPILDELAKEYNGKIKIYKVDTDKQKEVSAAFGIRSLPSILFIPAQGQPQMAQGALPKESFVKAIDEILLAPEANE